MTMKAIAVPFPTSRTVRMPAQRPAPTSRDDASRTQQNTELVALFDSIILEAYGLALLEVQSTRRAESVTNHVVDQLTRALRNNPEMGEEALRSLAYQSMHKELSKPVHRMRPSARLQDLHASFRHVFLAGAAAFVTGYVLLVAVI